MSRTQTTLKGNRCQCPACKEYFSTVSNFDRHRKTIDEKRICVSPESVGLEIKHGAAGTHWGMPGIAISTDSEEKEDEDSETQTLPNLQGTDNQ